MASPNPNAQAGYLAVLIRQLQARVIALETEPTYWLIEVPEPPDPPTDGHIFYSYEGQVWTVDAAGTRTVK